MGAASKLLATQTGESKLYVDDVFSTYLYTGNGATQTITNGIDLAGEGGMLWFKDRGLTTSHFVLDTDGGAGNTLNTNTTGARVASGHVTSFNSDGFSLNSYGGSNGTGNNYASWTFRKAPKFFDIVTYTGDGTTNRVISHSLGQEVGMIETKSTSASGNWNTYHRSSTGDLKLNLIDTQTASKTIVPSATASAFTVNGVANTNGVTYVAYLFAHDTEEDGMIQCGLFSGNTTVALGWEPQYIMYKRSDSTGNWIILDSMRGIPTGGVDAELHPNLSNAETASVSDYVTLNATGFTTTNLTGTYIYMAIRRPNKPPESGSEVYSSSTASGVITSGFTVDAHLGATRAGAATNHRFHSRLTGGTKELVTSTTAAETTVTDLKFDVMNGLGFSFAASEINHFFKRAKGFFDVVCYTGTGVVRTVNHNLGVAPEMMIFKQRSSAYGWYVRHNDVDPTKYLLLNTTQAETNFGATWVSGTSAHIDIEYGAAAGTNSAGVTYVAYLFASLPNISKVGSYTGNGTSQTINCGFSTGARFILIKRTDSTGDWYVWDTARGIVAANDPHLSLNTTAAEVTTDDSVDPESTGFIVNQVAATNINVNAASYIFLAIS